MAFKAHKAEKAYYLWSMGGYGISFVLALAHICERGRRMMLLVVTSASSWADVEIELILCIM